MPDLDFGLNGWNCGLRMNQAEVARLATLHDRTVNRRRLLTNSAGAALAGVAMMATGGAPTKAAANPIILVWRPWYNFPSATSSQGIKLLHDGTAEFRRQNPGVDLKITFLGYQDTTAAAILGGDGPDVFEDWVISDYTDRGLVLNLQPYIRRDNVDLTVFPTDMVRYLQVNGQSAPQGPGLYALPDYNHTVAQAVNEGLLDDLGIGYPEPDWTYQQWGEFWLKTSSKHSKQNGQPRVGGGFYWWSGHGNGAGPATWYWHGWGGDIVDPANNTKPAIDSPQSVAFARYLFNLMDEGAINQYGSGSGFLTGNQVSLELGTAGDLPSAASQYRSLKWSIYPMPTGPAGQFNGSFESFYAASRATKYPELAWQFVKWLCYEKTWARYMMRLALQGPIRLDLWDEWQKIVEAVAPPLRSVNLATFVNGVQGNHLWCGVPFRYYDSQCGSVINTWIGKILAKQVDVATGLAQAARQMASLQVVGSHYQGDLTAMRGFEAYMAQARSTPGSFTTPAPPKVDFGAASVPAPHLVAYSATSGSYAVTGGGTGLTGSSDGGTFACTAYTMSRGTFVCRLTGVSAVKDTSIAGGAKIGLMIRSSLSSGAATACVNVAMGHSVQFFTRPFPGASQSDQNTPGGGLLGAGGLLADNSKPASNYLLKPVWFKLVGDGGVWTAYTSLDGAVWTQAGSSAVVDVEGAWVGLFATSHNNGHFVRASFDHWSGAPPLATFVAFGANAAEEGSH